MSVSAFASLALLAPSCDSSHIMCSTDPKMIELYEMMFNNPLFENGQRPIKKDKNKYDTKPIKKQKPKKINIDNINYFEHLPFFNDDMTFQPKIYFNKFSNYEKSVKDITDKYEKYNGKQEPNIYEFITIDNEDDENEDLKTIKNINPFYFKKNHNINNLYILKINIYDVFDIFDKKISILGLDKYNYHISSTHLVVEILKEDDDDTYILIHPVYKYLPVGCIRGYKSVYFYDEYQSVDENPKYILCKIKTDLIYKKSKYNDITYNYNIGDKEITDKFYNIDNYKNKLSSYNKNNYKFKFISTSTGFHNNIELIDKYFISLEYFGLSYSYFFNKKYTTYYNFLTKINEFIYYYFDFRNEINDIIEDKKFTISYKKIRCLINSFNNMNDLHYYLWYVSKIFNDKSTISNYYNIDKYEILLKNIKSIVDTLYKLRNKNNKENEENPIDMYENMILFDRHLYLKLINFINLKINENETYYYFFLKINDKKF